MLIFSSFVLIFNDPDPVIKKIELPFLPPVGVLNSDFNYIESCSKKADCDRFF